MGEQITPVERAQNETLLDFVPVIQDIAVLVKTHVYTLNSQNGNANLDRNIRGVIDYGTRIFMIYQTFILFLDHFGDGQRNCCSQHIGSEGR